MKEGYWPCCGHGAEIELGGRLWVPVDLASMPRRATRLTVKIEIREWCIGTWARNENWKS